MESKRNDSDEPLTPAGRLFLQPKMDTVINCALGLQHQMDILKFKSAVMDSIMVQHPRFRSLMVKDHHGIEHWRKTQIDIDRHVIVINNTTTDQTQTDSSRAVNDYIAELAVSTPLSNDKPLWEFHILTAHNCLIFRIHHALGDGISLMSMFIAACRKVDDAEAVPTIGGGGGGSHRRRLNWSDRLLRMVTAVWFSLIFVIEFVLRALWVCDRETAITGGDGVELWPRKLATARFVLEDMKTVKKAVTDATINDVLFGVISCGLSRYLDHRSPNALREGQRITGVAMVNLREQPGLQDLSNLMKENSGSRWGNKFGMLLLPIYYHKSSGADSLEYVKRAKTMIDRKKKSIEGHFSYNIGKLAMSWLGAKVACMLNYRIVCNTSFTISNVLGPQEQISIAGTPVTYIRVTSTSLAHALTMHMVSYAGKADMQILVAKDIIPDPEFLAKCFEDALLEMKKAAIVSTKT